MVRFISSGQCEGEKSTNRSPRIERGYWTVATSQPVSNISSLTAKFFSSIVLDDNLTAKTEMSKYKSFYLNI